MTAQLINLYEELIIDDRNLYVSEGHDGFEVVLTDGDVVFVAQSEVRRWKRLKHHLLSLVVTQMAYRRVVARMPSDWRRTR